MVEEAHDTNSLATARLSLSVGARPRLWVWPGLLLAPTLFLAQLSLNYALVAVACASQRWSVLSLVPAITVGITVAATMLALRDVRRANRGTATDSPDLLLARCALAIGAFSSVAIGLQWATELVVHPCIQ